MMNQDGRMKAVEAIESIKTTDPDLRQTLQGMGNAIKTGNITGSSGILIGKGLRQVNNHYHLPPEAAAALVDLRVLLGSSLGLETSQYQISDIVLDRTRNFVGREHIFRRINEFIANRPSGYLTIEGDPGMGKSAILAKFVQDTLCLAHFNVRAQGIVSATQFLQNICAQLIAEANLTYSSLPTEATRDGAFLQKLLQETARKLGPDQKLIIAIDALDEVDLTSHPSGSNILFLPVNLPDGVYFILTRRQFAVPLYTQAEQEIIDLMSFPAENERDVRIYLNQAVARPKLHQWIDQRSGLSVSSFIDRMVELSELNFMYLRYVLPEIESGQYQEFHINKLPQGLEGYYLSHWKHMGMTAKPLPRAKIRVVYVLCEARQPVSRSFIAHIAKDTSLQFDDLTVQEVLDEWDQFLHEQEAQAGKLYSMYHASFRDFLHRQDIVKAAGVSIANINSVIADNLWEDLFGVESR
jgi:hypothetical protein